LFNQLLEELQDPDHALEVLEQVREQAQEYFWDLPCRVDDGTVGLDGATWAIEGTRNGKCHVVKRWSPAIGTDFRIFADTLMDLSGVRFYYDEVY
jgi:hypothetical protein